MRMHDQVAAVELLNIVVPLREYLQRFEPEMVRYLWLRHVLAVMTPKVLRKDLLVFEHVEELDVSVQSVVVI
jgi:hypothetical protein